MTQPPRRSFYTLLGVPDALPSLPPLPPLPAGTASTVTPTRLAQSSTTTTTTSSTFDPAHKFVTSPVFRNPFVFGGLRMLTGLYALITIVYLLAYYSITLHAGPSFFSYFTYLAYVGLTAYMFASGTQTLLYALRWRKNGAGAGYPLQTSWPRALQALHVVLYATIVTFPIIVTVVYWALLASPTTFGSTESSWSAISIHILNLLFSTCEILLSNSPAPPWVALPLTLIFLLAYLGIAYLTHHTQGIYPYSFLDPHKTGTLLAAYIIGIALAQCLVFVIVHFVVRFRERVALKYRRILCVNGCGVGRGGEDADDEDADDGEEGEEEEWEEVERPVVPRGQKSVENVRGTV